MNNPAPAQMNIDLSAAEEIKCESCEKEVFTQCFLIKKVSALISPNGQEMIVPIQTFRCAECGTVNKEFQPD